ncbi:sigma-54-dependent transcriptional regulator [Aeromonas hydrophila]|uniref:sigma-54-dependent transcriptional regulator n=1 Tax=Aeromonas hydrophila TaxID=644 RepID=UPI000332B22A|nr:sigma-54 dependent transcriptional regulator [Aeromonas hydrophila]AGM41814.1 C4-dicarboxylate transport transcriptional regulatory protein DctD [Aeromonas hydrophila ML09-119]AHX30558.1 chemotaxis protein CheY [Aeromonas hydrophila subsp. hydrophila AL09-71]AHX67355.1 chemotaxis protein CheY [Aeromonas hydrophila pc104A]AJE34432.1 chemotaxis protein CheY [Aeromonas hydrophila J-1]AKJ32628.1 chemotaxis protein CheY [Aeromonas hydrophila NJ-35]
MLLPANRPANVLLVDDDEDVLESYCHLLRLSGYHPRATTSPHEALALLADQWPGVLVSDIYMPAMNGMDLLASVQALDAEIPVIMITGHGDIPLAVRAVKQGAFDFLEKPLNPQDLLGLLERACRQRSAVLARRSEIQATVDDELIGTSPQIVTLRSQLNQLAQTDKDLLLEGPAGSGRHTLARLLHRISARREQVFQLHDCVSAPSLAEVQASLAQAGQGTLVLQSPARLSADCQRWLGNHLLDQERKGSKSLRTIGLFDESPEVLVERQQLMPELYYFLSQVRLKLPRLVERSCDIIPLFRAFLRQGCKRIGRPVPAVDRAYLETLKRHQWPGNLRELRNVAELYAVGIVKLAGAEQVIPLASGKEPLDDLVEEFERRVIEDTLFLFSGRVTDAAQYLGIPRKKLYLRMKKHQLDKDRFKPAT